MKGVSSGRIAKLGGGGGQNAHFNLCDTFYQLLLTIQLNYNNNNNYYYYYYYYHYYYN
jgi:hypothetical protein